MNSLFIPENGYINFCGIRSFNVSLKAFFLIFRAFGLLYVLDLTDR